MWVKELHNPTSIMELNNWYLQPHSWFMEIQKRFVELLIYVFLIRFKEIHNVLWLFMELHKCNQYNIIDLWSPIIKSPRSGVTSIFSVRFRPVRHRRVRRRNDFYLERQNHLSYILDIWSKEYIGLAKCTGWTFHDLDPRPRLWHRLANICLSARQSENHSSDHYKT